MQLISELKIQDLFWQSTAVKSVQKGQLIALGKYIVYALGKYICICLIYGKYMYMPYIWYIYVYALYMLR